MDISKCTKKNRKLSLFYKRLKFFCIFYLFYIQFFHWKTTILIHLGSIEFPNNICFIDFLKWEKFYTENFQVLQDHCCINRYCVKAFRSMLQICFDFEQQFKTLCWEYFNNWRLQGTRWMFKKGLLTLCDYFPL